MNKLFTLLFTTMFLGAAASCQTPVSVKVEVVGEDQSPIPEAEVSVRYLGYGKRDEETVSGLTNEEGVFLSKRAADLRIVIFVEKGGYYKTRSQDLDRGLNHNITLHLREKKNPIGLYAVKLKIKPPAMKKSYGFDFQERDWIVPYGKGKKAMCFFQMETHVISDDRHMHELAISFPNKLDGILKIDPKSEYLESDFTWLYEAPQEGYEERMTFSRNRIPGAPLSFDAENFSYALRVNTELDEHGNILSANYIRVSKGMGLYGVLSSTPSFGFTYYYNPKPNDRNLEFDPQNNLFRGLNIDEQVHEP